MPTKKRDVAQEIRNRSIKANATESAANKTKKKAKKKVKRSAFGDALSNLIDVFKVQKTLKKAAKK